MVVVGLLCPWLLVLENREGGLRLLCLFDRTGQQSPTCRFGKGGGGFREGWVLEGRLSLSQYTLGLEEPGFTLTLRGGVRARPSKVRNQARDTDVKT